MATAILQTHKDGKDQGTSVTVTHNNARLLTYLGVTYEHVGEDASSNYIYRNQDRTAK